MGLQAVPGTWVIVNRLAHHQAALHQGPVRAMRFGTQTSNSVRLLLNAARAPLKLGSGGALFPTQRGVRAHSLAINDRVVPPG